ncbi:MAG: Holliday junction resolvase RuvX [Thermaceae bacterium]
MRLAALDVGRARIGLAVGEEGLPFAFGRGYLVRRGLEEDVKALLGFFARERVKKVVVGLPLRTDLKESEEAQAVLRLAEALRARGVEVELMDERYTTRLAQRRLAHAPKRVRREKGRLDELAAVILLEDYLARGTGMGT